MRFMICALVALALFVVPSFGSIAGSHGTPGSDGNGVGDGDTWSTPTGSHTVTITVEGHSSGFYEVGITEDGTTGTTSEGDGDNTDDVDSTPEVSVGEEKYRANGGKMQWKNGSGGWVDMIDKTKKGPKPKDTSTTEGSTNFVYDGGFLSPEAWELPAIPDGGFATDDEFIGTLP